MHSQLALRQRLWRWHFFAGLIVCPFACLLAITGSIYLFKPQVDAYIESSANAKAPAIALGAAVMSSDQLLSGLLANQPEARLKMLVLAKPNDRSIEIELIQENGAAEIFWLDRYTGTVLDSALSSERFLNVVKRIHSELLLGDLGSYFVELMASWLIVLMLTGLYLWLAKPDSQQPSKLRRWFAPRLKDQTSRPKVASLHGVIGIWFALPILLLLFSGLPWTQLWGSGFKQVQGAMGWTGPGQQWRVTLESKSPEQGALVIEETSLWQIDRDPHAHHQEVGSGPTGLPSYTGTLAIERIEENLQRERLVSPVQIHPPQSATGVWTVRSMPQQRSERVTINYDQYTGQELMRVVFEDHHRLQRLASQGISLHEGVLFGWLNQLLGLLTALSIITMSIFGLLSWWLRRLPGSLAAPTRPLKPVSLRFGLLILVLGIMLPAAGISFAVVIFFEGCYCYYKGRGLPIVQP